MPKMSAAMPSAETLPTPTQDSVQDRLRRFRGYIRTWLKLTAVLRLQMKRDYAYADGDQLSDADREKLIKERRPPLVFNELEPVIDLIAGMQVDLKTDYTALPRGVEDKRLGELATATLKAARDWTRFNRKKARMFLDGVITGMGAVEILHRLDDADDLIWGDVRVNRINPLAFIWDPWATQDDLQDGRFMGKATWMPIDEAKKRYADKPGINVGEWLNATGFIGSAEDFGLGQSFQGELIDQERGMVRIVTLWYKVPKRLTFLVNLRTGEMEPVDSREAGEERLREIRQTEGRQVVNALTIQESEQEVVVQNQQTNQVLTDPTTGVPFRFDSAESAQAMLDMLADRMGFEVQTAHKVLTRQAQVPYWVEMSWWDILEEGKTPFTDRQYPYIPYISRQYSDDPTSIQGVVRQRRDRQDEINKRYSNLLAHLNSTAHSGYFNRKSGGANTTELRQMGSAPGVVVEYTTTMPFKIEPSQISTGHFALLQHNLLGIQRTSGVTAELAGQTTQQTVSGRAIRARQQGGLTIIRPRLDALDEADLNAGRMLLRRIQQFYPPQKIRRIIGVAEATSPLGPNQQSIFADPVTGRPMPEAEIIELLSRMRAIQFDLSLGLQPFSPTQRQAQFEQAVQLAGMITSTGRPLGSKTMEALVEMSDMPTDLEQGLRQDLQAEQQAAVTEQGGLNDQLQGFISNIRGGRAGGSEGVTGNA